MALERRMDTPPAGGPEAGVPGAAPIGPRPMSEAVLGRLLPVLRQTLKMRPDELLANPDTRIVENRKDPDEETLGASSLQALRAANAVETTFGFKVPPEEIATFRTLRSIAHKIEDVEAERAKGGSESV